MELLCRYVAEPYPILHSWSLLGATGDRRNPRSLRCTSSKGLANVLIAACPELRPTGKLIVVMPAIDDSGFHGAESIHDAANDCLAELVACGTISADEQASMCMPSRLRSRAQLLEPFSETGSFAGLTVEHCDIFRVPEAAWAVYLEHGDAQLLAAARTGFFRSVFIPSLAEALVPTRPPSDKVMFADALEAALTRRMAAELHELPGTATTMVVSRQPD